jgi:hypothetical protein
MPIDGLDAFLLLHACIGLSVGSQHAATLFLFLWLSSISTLAQRTRFCTVGGARHIKLINDFHLVFGVTLTFLPTFRSANSTPVLRISR